MFRASAIIVLLFLSALLNAQRIANFASNGSFEDTLNLQNFIIYPRCWGALDTNTYFGVLLRSPNQVPKSSLGFQQARTGKNIFVLSPFSTYTINNRGYSRNRLRQNLASGKRYCVAIYVALTNQSTHAIDAIGAYLGDGTLDTIKNCTNAITFLTPQVANPAQNIITDTLNWTAITGTFIATGNEKYLLIGNFKSDTNTNTTLTNTTNLPANFAEYYIDDVSCIEMDVAAYAGPDKPFFSGDSVYIGRELDFAVDPYCFWYKLPNTATPIDTASGLWVKPTTTSTYVVRQELECNTVKWDTVVVYKDAVGLNKLKIRNEELKIGPNPASDRITVSYEDAALSSYFEIAEIVDAQGRVFKQLQITETEMRMEINTEDLADGIYMLRLIDYKNENLVLKKLSVQH